MGFAKADGYYPDGKDRETAEPIKEIEPPVSPSTIPELVPKKEEVIPPPEEKLSDTHFVINTFNNRTAVNTDRRAQIVDDLKGFANGSAVEVTYYKQTFAESDTKGIPKDADTKMDRTHKSMLKIHGFELRMLGSLSFEHDSSDNVVRVSGEAVTYPGFEPSQGDKFIMEVDNGKWGEMDIIEVPTRMAVKSGTYYKIQFSLVHWMSEERQKILDDFVFNEAWFDKQRFLNEPGALLYHAEYVDMKFFELQSAQMVVYHVNKFLDKQLMFTYMRPDGVYDPYVVDFCLKTIDFNEAGCVAAQLFRDAPCIETSIWRALLSETVPLAAVPTSSVVAKRTLGSKTVMINSLLNKKYVAFEPGSISLLEFFEQEDGEVPGEGDDPCGGLEPGDFAGDPDKDRIMGDVLLHIHPHFRECVLTCCGDCCCCGDTVTDDTNSALAYLLDGSDEWKTLIRSFLRYRKINVDFLRNCIKGVYKLDPIEQFYKIPILVFLARTTVRYIHNNAGIYE